MRFSSLALEVPNSLLYIRDPQLLARPEIDGAASVWSTRSCVAVSCLPDCDGPTTVVIGPSQEVGRDKALVFDDILETPSRDLVVEIVPGVEVLRVEAPQLTTRVRIWTNGHHDSDNVVIGLD